MSLVLINPFQVSPIVADFIDLYTTNTGWTKVGTLVDVDLLDDNQCEAVLALNSADNRVHKDTAIAWSDTLWYYNVDFKRIDSNGDINFPVTLSSATGDPEDANQDEIGLYSGGAADLKCFYKDSAGAYTISAGAITITIGTQYYLRIERTSATQIKLSVFTDSARTTHQTGSPITQTIPSTVTTLQYLMHGTVSNTGTQGSSWTIDNTYIFNNRSP